MPKAIVVVQNVPYYFTLERKSGIDPQFDFIDFEFRDILCHVKYRVESNVLVSNSRLEGMWKKEQVISLDDRVEIRVEVRFGPYRAWVSCNGSTIELELPFRTVSSRIGLLDVNGFSEPANLLASDFMHAPALKSSMSSIEYAVIDARLSMLEDLVKNLMVLGQPASADDQKPTFSQEKVDRGKVNIKNGRQTTAVS